MAALLVSVIAAITAAHDAAGSARAEALDSAYGAPTIAIGIGLVIAGIGLARRPVLPGPGRAGGSYWRSGSTSSCRCCRPSSNPSCSAGSRSACGCSWSPRSGSSWRAPAEKRTEHTGHGHTLAAGTLDGRVWLWRAR